MNCQSKKRDKKRDSRRSIKFRCDYSSTPLKVLQSRGWTRIHDVKDTTWDLWWCDTSDLRLALDELRLRPQQRVAHFRNHGELTRKNYLYRNLRRYRRLLLKAGKGREAELCDAMPITFELPSEYRMLVEEYRRRPGTTWIVKPAGGSQGKGIFLFQRLKDLSDWRAKECVISPESQDLDTPICPQSFVVQKYIDDPYLLGGRKFDLRIYVLVTSFQPLKVWLAREGFARLSGKRFTLEHIDDSRVHLTNMAIQLKGRREVVASDEEGAPEKSAEEEGIRPGRKWPLRSLRQYLTARHGHTAVNELLHNIAESPEPANCMDNKLENVSDDIYNFKKQQQKNNQLIFKSFVVTPSKTRDLLNTLRIGWLYKKDPNKTYSKMKKPLGGIKRLKLNESQIYSALEIKEMAIKEFTSSKNHTIMDKLSFELGFSDGRIVDHFKRPDGKICDVWAYCEAYNISLYKLNLFLLSASINGKDVDFIKRTANDDKDSDLDVRFKKAKIKDGNKVSENIPLIEDNIGVFYHYIRVSKYSNEQSYTECTKVDLYAYVLDDQSGVMPTVEEFDPLDYGYMISRLSKNERVFLQIYVNEDGSKSFVFPSSSITNVTTCHTILHDIDEVQGIYEGRLGIGIVTNCNNDCRPTFTWYRDDEVFRTGEYLYWLSDISSDDDGKAHTWFCSVTCREIKDELISKVVQIS